MSRVPASGRGSLLKAFARMLPTKSSYKGSSGRVCIVGGSVEYTGAPYYAAMSALRGGSDLALVFCHPLAATAIKCYSPELIVHPHLGDDGAESRSNMATLSRCSAVCVGPGLGRRLDRLKMARSVLESCIASKTPLILDGDALFLLSDHLSAGSELDFSSVNRTTALSPNAMEFRRLWQRYVLPSADSSSSVTEAVKKGSTVATDELPPFNVTLEDCRELEEAQWYACADVSGKCEAVRDTATLARALGGVTLIRKSQVDVICDGNLCAVVKSPATERRCGGQGDILAGLCSANVHFARGSGLFESEESPSPAFVAAFGACHILRNCAWKAFEKKKRSTLTTDVLQQLPETIEELFPFSASRL